MLVLTRKKDETIKIGDDIEIKVIGINGDQVKIGIEAPNHVEIHRKEIYLSIQEENNAASHSSLDLLQALTNQLKK